MKMKETLTMEEKNNLFINSEVVGIFNGMILPTDPFFDLAHSMCLGYYTVRSANKTVSPIYEQAYEYAKEVLASQGESGEIDKYEVIALTNTLLGSSIIRPKFIDKWLRVYDTLITKQYDALKGFEHTEHKEGNNSDTTTYDTSVGKTGDNTDTVTYNSQNGRTGNNTDTITYNTNTEDNGKTGTKETTTTNRENSADVYGFNSASPVGDNTDTENATETVIGNADDNTTHNVQTKTGTETKGYEVDETVAKTGTDTKNITISETENKTGTDTKNFVIDEDVTKSGRNATGAELVEAELNLRNTQIFFDIVYRDIDSVVTLAIYV